LLIFILLHTTLDEKIILKMGAVVWFTWGENLWSHWKRR